MTDAFQVSSAALSNRQRAAMTPAKRLSLIRDCLRASERIRLIVCDLLAEAWEGQDWHRLGLSSFTEYADALGISQSQASKMLKIGRAFPESMRSALSDVDVDELSVERLYVSAQRVERGVDPETALHDAVAHPAEQLVALRDGTEPADARPVECPYCGASHLCYQAPHPVPGDERSGDAPLG